MPLRLQSTPRVGGGSAFFVRRPEHFMKIIITLVTLLAASFTAEAQGDILVSGQTFDYSFSSLSFIGPASFLTWPYEVSLGWVDGTFQAGSSVTLSLFETSTSETPFQTVDFDGSTFGSVNSASVVGGTPGQDSPVWQDLQGVVRLSVTSGSIEVNQLGCETVVGGVQYAGFALIPGGSGPIPEPRTSTLLMMAFALAIIGKRRWTPPMRVHESRVK